MLDWLGQAHAALPALLWPCSLTTVAADRRAGRATPLQQRQAAGVHQPLEGPGWRSEVLPAATGSPHANAVPVPSPQRTTHVHTGGIAPSQALRQPWVRSAAARTGAGLGPTAAARPVGVLPPSAKGATTAMVLFRSPVAELWAPVDASIAHLVCSAATTRSSTSTPRGRALTASWTRVAHQTNPQNCSSCGVLRSAMIMGRSAFSLAVCGRVVQLPHVMTQAQLLHFAREFRVLPEVVTQRELMLVGPRPSPFQHSRRCC